MHALKNLAVAAAMVALVASAQAEYYPGSTDFEGESPLTDARNPTVVSVTTYGGVTVTGVESGQAVIPGTNLIINVSVDVDGYVPSVTIYKHEDYSELLTTNAVSFTYTMPDFDIDIVAVAVSPSFDDPEGYAINDPSIAGWLVANGFTQADINDLGSDAAATDKLYECYLLNCSIKRKNPGGALTNTAIAVTNDVSAKFFKAKIEFPHPEGDPDDPGEEPEPDPEE